MRASRLLSILMLLQLRGRQTADALAAEFEVSVRTIYRDVDELAASGVPVLSDRGPGGGFQLQGGYRTQLTGLASDEAEAMLMIGLPDAATALGMGQAAKMAGRKLMAALPTTGRDSAQRISERFHVDALDWYRDSDAVPQLPAIARAVLDARALLMRYESWSGRREWRVWPLGLVLKAGAWYLVASRIATELSPRTFKVVNIMEHTVLDARFTPPHDFNLAEYWRASTVRFEAGLRREQATLRASKIGRFRLSEMGRFAKLAVSNASEPDADDWATLVLPIENIEHAARLLLGIGPEVEVLAPESLRDALRTAAAQIIHIHSHSTEHADV
ncbi:MAG: WYL domain-containing protein [Betaproteobacteria bacterium]|nr:MAG: WYL domain-containing protein [Betaproteobacteria bacterium]